jgi:hypothetical protein
MDFQYKMLIVRTTKTTKFKPITKALFDSVKFEIVVVYRDVYMFLPIK